MNAKSKLPTLKAAILAIGIVLFAGVSHASTLSCAAAFLGTQYPHTVFVYDESRPSLFGNLATEALHGEKNTWTMQHYTKEERKKLLGDAAINVVAEFRKDPNLHQFSDFELYKAALRVIQKRFVISPSIGLGGGSRTDVHAALEFERYRFYLIKKGIDPKARPKSFSALAKQFGYSSLGHSTNLAGLKSVLMDGAISPRSENGANAAYGGSNEYIYVEALPKPLEDAFFRSGGARWSERVAAYVELDAKVLDEVVWSHMNIYWMYGEKNPAYSVEPSNMLAGFFNLVENYQRTERPGGSFTQWGARNEFLFTGPIDIKRFVLAIHVPSGIREGLRRELKDQGVDPRLIRLVK